MDKPRWTELLHEAVSKPGALNECYNRFHGYSIGNQFLALWQCHERNIEPGPISTYKGWQNLGRQVKAGETALTLCMPVTVKEKEKDINGDLAETGDVLTVFVYKPRWFVLAQTEGDGIVPEPRPLTDWSLDRAADSLDIARLPFTDINGNTQGFAKGKAISVSPIAANPAKTGIHEIAHVLLGHTSDGAIVDGEVLVRSIVEAEAEAVALIVTDALGLPGQESCRAYIQHWWGTDPIPEASARRIFTVADRILKAGHEQAALAKAA